MRLAISLLTTTAGRVLRISPPTDGWNATHQSSPRRGNSAGLIGYIPNQALAPRQRFGLARFLARHVRIGCFQALRRDMGPCQIIEKATNAARPDAGTKPVINIRIDRYCELLHRLFPYTYNIRISGLIARGCYSSCLCFPLGEPLASLL